MEGLETARGAVRQASLLVAQPNPEALDRCQALLEEARRELQSATHSFDPRNAEGEAGMRAGLAELRRRLAGLSLLLDHAAGFYAGWVRLRNTLTGGYTAEGEPAPPVSAGRLSLEA
jgi:hypothetical protein